MFPIERFLADANLLTTSGIIAISGGPDSVALAHAANQLRQRGVIGSLHLAHLNHQLRGDDGDGDEAFVVELGRAWDIPVSTRRVDIRALAGNLEDAARRVRYEWLGRVARRENAAWIATGHTADDLAETVLHHFLRGSGLAGLAGIAARRRLDGVDLIRPLLTTRRCEIVAYLQAEKLSWRTDASNADVAFTRNRLRHELLPALERDYNPALVDVLCRTAAQASELQEELRVETERHLAVVELPRVDGMLVFSRERLAALSSFWIREIFRFAWRREGWPTGEMTFDDWSRCVALSRGQLPRHDFPGGVGGRCVLHVVQLRHDATEDLVCLNKTIG